MRKFTKGTLAGLHRRGLGGPRKHGGIVPSFRLDGQGEGSYSKSMKRRANRSALRRRFGRAKAMTWRRSKNHLGHKEWFSRDGHFVITTDGWSGYSLDQKDEFRRDRIGYFDSLAAAQAKAARALVRRRAT